MVTSPFHERLTASFRRKVEKRLWRKESQNKILVFSKNVKVAAKEKLDLC